jgi:hypothetical protein
MPQGNASHERTGVLPLEIIDDLGRVLDTVYVTEITGTSIPALQRRASTHNGVHRRDD